MTQQADIELSFGDYLGVLKRRARILLAVMGVIVLAGVAIAYRVSPTYESSGVLLAEQPEVPEHVVRSTVPDYPEERVRIITQRVLTNDNLARIIDERGLYPELADSRGAALREFRDHLGLSAEDPEILENIMGASNAAGAMAFSVTFAHSMPLVARDVATDLVSLYLEENQRARQEQAASTTQFLTREAERLDDELAQREQRLTEFKERNAGSLPELSNTNIQLLDRVERDIETTDQQLRALREQQALYRSELAQLSPHAPVVDEQGATLLGPAERLKVLQRRYAQQSAVYSQDHPDVAALRREIDALSAAVGVPAFDRTTLQAELVAREEQLATARDRYSDDHPDVRRLERTVEGLRASLAEAPARPAAASSAALPPDNPVYIQRQVQLQASDAELDALLERRSQLEGRRADLESRLTATPAVEGEYNILSRGYEQLRSQYAEVQAKLRAAEIAQNLETESKGERFTVLQTPTRPDAPASPNRLAVLLLTLVTAVAFGAGAVAIAENSDTTLRKPGDVTRFLEIPPLVAIPYVNNGDDRRRRTRQRLVTVGATCAWAAVVVMLVTNPAG